MQAKYMTSGGIVNNGPVTLLGVVIDSPTTADSITLYDGTDATGKNLIKLSINTNIRSQSVMFPKGIYCNNLFAAIVSTNASCYVYWE